MICSPGASNCPGRMPYLICGHGESVLFKRICTIKANKENECMAVTQTVRSPILPRVNVSPRSNSGSPKDYSWREQALLFFSSGAENRNWPSRTQSAHTSIIEDRSECDKIDPLEVIDDDKKKMCIKIQGCEWKAVCRLFGGHLRMRCRPYYQTFDSSVACRGA